MLIKDVEQRTGLSRENIRYYEKEKLIFASRNPVSHYREYSEEDVLLLQKIKLLRAIGLSIHDIRSIISQPDTLCDYLERRKAELKDEKIHLNVITKLCNSLSEEGITFETLEPTGIDEKEPLLCKFIEQVRSEDITSKERVLTFGTLIFALAAILVRCMRVYHIGWDVFNGAFPWFDELALLLFVFGFIVYFVERWNRLPIYYPYGHRKDSNSFLIMGIGLGLLETGWMVFWLLMLAILGMLWLIGSWIYEKKSRAAGNQTSGKDL